MQIPEEIGAFIERLEQVDRQPPLSEAKLLALGEPSRYVSVEEDGELRAIGVVADHPQATGGVHRSVETAVEPSMRFVEFEAVVLAQALALAGSGVPTSVWSRRRSLDAALEQSGFVVERSLANMEMDLPLGDGAVEPTRSMNADEIGVLVAVNRASFGDHREAGSLNEDEVAVLMAEPWFALEDVRLHEGPAGIDAFCWTKRRGNAVGEIYRIGVIGSARGHGLGRAMTIAGFHHLATTAACTKGSLWADESNEPAMRVYRGIGMDIVARNREFRREEPVAG